MCAASPNDSQEREVFYKRVALLNVFLGPKSWPFVKERRGIEQECHGAEEGQGHIDPQQEAVHHHGQVHPVILQLCAQCQHTKLLICILALMS